MFQNGRLFEHLTVGGNLAFADKRSRGGAAKYSFDDVVAGFDLGPLMDRRPASLSGGERQRAALARTLLARPELLLLDEPLAALDRARKREILPFLEDLPKRFGLPCLYVSHDIEEVSRLADNILVLSKGRVEAYGAAADIIGRLDLEPLTGRFEAGSLLTGVVINQDSRLALTRVKLGEAVITMPINKRLSVGDIIRLRIRARDVAIATAKPENTSIRNMLSGVINAVNEDLEGPFASVVIDLGEPSIGEQSISGQAISGQALRARITRAAIEDLGLKKGQSVYALVKSVSFEGRLT
jgi:molybdate transport system ATP-binding protein